MALVLNAVPMSASANSYATLAEAVAYLEGRLNVAAWTAAATGLREQALASATKAIDQREWDGCKTTTAQALEWPRLGLVDKNGNEVDETTIPAFLRDATIEEALAQLQQPAGADGSGLAAFSSVTVGPISVDVKGNGQSRQGLCAAAMRLLARYMTGSGQPRIMRG